MKNEFIESDYKIYTTTNYDMFKKLRGNRQVADSRANNIAESMSIVGVQPSPILVNGNFEVIDGQGRLEACRRLGRPVYFTIKDNIGLSECIAMNTTATVWTLHDYVVSYAVKGNPNYQLLERQIKENPSLSLSVLAQVFCKKVASNKSIEIAVKSGTYEAEITQSTIGCMNFIKQAKEELKRNSLDTSKSIPALVVLFKCGLIDSNKMLCQLTKYGATMKDATKVADVVDELQKVYNFRSREPVYFRDKYIELMTARPKETRLI